MTPLERLKLRTQEPDEAILQDYLYSARFAYLKTRDPNRTQPETIADEPYALDWQFRVAYAMYLKRGGEYESSHTENGVSRAWTSEGIPKELLAEIVPLVAVI